VCDGRILLDGKRQTMCDEREVMDGARQSAERVWGGFADYHWAGRALDEEFPPAIRPGEGD
jgi:hypothetical protein